MSTPASASCRLPIGVQTFRHIRQGGYCYVDKTPLCIRLAEEGKYYFLSRPRRFGKSLLIDTLAELFAGSQALFAGLYAHDHWDWAVRHPVIRLSFAGGVLGSRAELLRRIQDQLRINRERLGLSRPPAVVAEDVAGDLSELIRQAHCASGQCVVVLVDEYDKPLLDNLEQPDVARSLREGLRDLYSVIKDCDAHVRFAMLTGVSKFGKVSLFSGLNNLVDITLDARYSTLCGYTEEDLDTVFAAPFAAAQAQGAALPRQQVRRWYNGYSWGGESVYNPFDVLLLLRNRQFRAYWFETGTPTFWVDLLVRRGISTPSLAGRLSNEQLLSAFDVEHIHPDALLFQTGYLTVARSQELSPGLWTYTLDYPNLEVRTSLNAALLEGLGVEGSRALANRVRLLSLLREPDFEGLREVLSAFFASIPHQWLDNNPIARYEGYWASVFYSHFAALGLDIVAEESSAAGRLDMAVREQGRVFLFEFKVVELEPQGRALAQLLKRGYADKYRSRGQPVHLVGVEFSRARRQIVDFAVQTLG